MKWATTTNNLNGDVLTFLTIPRGGFYASSLINLDHLFSDFFQLDRNVKYIFITIMRYMQYYNVFGQLHECVGYLQGDPVVFSRCESVNVIVPQFLHHG